MPQPARNCTGGSDGDCSISVLLLIVCVEQLECVVNVQFKAHILSIDRNDNANDAAVLDVEPAVDDGVEPTEDEQATEEPSVSHGLLSSMTVAAWLTFCLIFC